MWRLPKFNAPESCWTSQWRRSNPRRNRRQKKTAPPQVKSNVSKPAYLQAVRRAKEYIRAGDIFQCVISQRFSAKTQAEPFQIYRELRALNPSPYLFICN